MAELAIIADDLTGALDAAAPFALRGIQTAVALHVDTLPEALATGARVVGVSTDSREVSAQAAHDAVRAAIAALPAGVKLFKKIDSRLKGNIAAELDAIPHAHSLVIPAIPAFGRWMKGGKLGGFGVAEPIDIAARLGRHAATATIPDIATQADIDAALAASHDLPIGARGLAQAMVHAIAPGANLPETAVTNRKAYLVIGSTDPITLAQLHRLREADPGAAYLAAPNGYAPVAGRSTAALTIIQATPGPRHASSEAVAMALGQTLAHLAPPPGSLLVLSGGATAQAVLGQLGIGALHLVGEALTGLPLARGGDLTVVTKSGGFGDENTLQRLLAPFRAQEERIALS